jgi:hypothetical protein
MSWGLKPRKLDNTGRPVPYRAARIAFWCGVAIAGTLLLHVAMILVVRLAGWRPPAWLEFPRAELAVMLLLLQPIAQCTGRECWTESFESLFFALICIATV